MQCCFIKWYQHCRGNFYFHLQGKSLPLIREEGGSTFPRMYVHSHWNTAHHIAEGIWCENLKSHYQSLDSPVIISNTRRNPTHEIISQCISCSLLYMNFSLTIWVLKSVWQDIKVKYSTYWWERGKRSQSTQLVFITVLKVINKC